MKPDKPCKDCVAEGITTKRPAEKPGPRCVTHWRAVVNARKYSAHARRLENNFGISDEQYWRIYESQDGRCYICQRATGKTKRLAVDHDHDLCEHDPKVGCPQCIRALLCGPCNQMVGRYRVDALQRAIIVLTDPPAQRILSA